MRSGNLISCKRQLRGRVPAASSGCSQAPGGTVDWLETKAPQARSWDWHALVLSCSLSTFWRPAGCLWQLGASSQHLAPAWLAWALGLNEDVWSEKERRWKNGGEGLARSQSRCPSVMNFAMIVGASDFFEIHVCWRMRVCVCVWLLWKNIAGGIVFFFPFLGYIVDTIEVWRIIKYSCLIFMTMSYEE